MVKSRAVDAASEEPTPRQMKEFWLQVERGQITRGRFQLFLRGQIEVTELLAEWERFYLDVFGIKVDLSSVKGPKPKPGFGRLIVVIPEMTPQKVFDKCQKLFTCWKYTDQSLDEVIDFSKEARSAKDGPYAVWFRDVVEADPKLKNFSANNLAKKKISGITLTERLLYELVYFRETGEHLDIQNWTLCAGSRSRDGVVLGVRWGGDSSGLGVFWYRPSSSRDDLRSRQVGS